jgi:hypothetical protein
MKDFTKISDLCEALIKELKLFNENVGAESPKVEKRPKVDEPVVELVPITLVEVRQRLAGLSRDGHTSEIQSLIKGFGAKKLSEIDPKDYEAVMEAALEIEKHGGK